VSNNVLFPGAGFFELATASLATIVGPRAVPQGASLAFCDAVIPAALPLPGKLSAQESSVALRCFVETITGELQIASSPTSFKQQHVIGYSKRVFIFADVAVDAGALQRSVHLSVSTFSKQAPSLTACVDNTSCGTSEIFSMASLDNCLQLAAAASE